MSARFPDPVLDPDEPHRPPRRQREGEPRPASASAAAAPIPWLAPVTMATGGPPPAVCPPPADPLRPGGAETEPGGLRSR